MTRQVTAIAIWLAGLSYLACCVDQLHFTRILIAFAAAFTGYALLVSKSGYKINWIPLIGLAVAGRLIFFPWLPRLSDDIYRFIWDGLLLSEGISPLSSTPESLMSAGAVSGTAFEALFPLLNSKEYFTVYPPIIQWFNYGTFLLSGDNWLAFAGIQRTFFILADLLAARMLWLLSPDGAQKKWLVSLWLLNPLLITECTGNLHAEGLLVSMLLTAVYFLQLKRVISSALAMGGAILVKLHPLLTIPLLVFRLGLRKSLPFLLTLTTLLTAAFALTFQGEISGMSTSLSLYFNRFEFNAGIYYLLRSFISVFTGYNPIQWLGPGLAIVTVVVILVVSWLNRGETVHRLSGTMALLYGTYLLLSTTVHPWYVLVPMGLAILSVHRPLFILWSFLAVFSYSHYNQGTFAPDWLWISLEYGILTIAAIALWWNRKSNTK